MPFIAQVHCVPTPLHTFPQSTFTHWTVSSTMPVCPNSLDSVKAWWKHRGGQLECVMLDQMLMFGLCASLIYEVIPLSSGWTSWHDHPPQSRYDQVKCLFSAFTFECFSHQQFYQQFKWFTKKQKQSWNISIYRVLSLSLFRALFIRRHRDLETRFQRL